jgi:hypothetical protein
MSISFSVHEILQAKVQEYLQVELEIAFQLAQKEHRTVTISHLLLARKTTADSLTV